MFLLTLWVACRCFVKCMHKTKAVHMCRASFNIEGVPSCTDCQGGCHQGMFQDLLLVFSNAALHAIILPADDTQLWDLCPPILMGLLHAAVHGPVPAPAGPHDQFSILHGWVTLQLQAGKLTAMPCCVQPHTMLAIVTVQQYVLLTELRPRIASCKPCNSCSCSKVFFSKHALGNGTFLQTTRHFSAHH